MQDYAAYASVSLPAEWKEKSRFEKLKTLLSRKVLDFPDGRCYFNASDGDVGKKQTTSVLLD